jgi:hypothetical protein
LKNHYPRKKFAKNSEKPLGAENLQPKSYDIPTKIAHRCLEFFD